MDQTKHLQLEAAMLRCTACPLHQDAIGPTSYSGTPTSPLMIVGEGPGGVEDEYGVPLVGPSGHLLDKALASVKVTRDRIYTTNVIKCRPKGNRTPSVAEGEFCASRWLEQEIASVQPKVIVALGSVALRYLGGPDKRITRERGLWFTTKHGIPALATYHPAYLLRLTGNDLTKAKWDVFHDLQSAVTRCLELQPTAVLQSTPAPDLLQLYQGRRQERRERRANIDGQ